MKRIHAKRNGTKRPLCEKRQGKTSSDPEAVNCVDCGRVASEIVAAAEAAAGAQEPATGLRALGAAGPLHARQEAALASNQPPRWWEHKTDG